MTSRSVACWTLFGGAAAVLCASGSALAWVTPQKAIGARSLETLREGGSPALTARQEAAKALIAAHVFSSLSPEQQEVVHRVTGFDPSPRMEMVIPGRQNEQPYYERIAPLGDEDYRVVRRFVGREDFSAMLPVHQRALVDMVVAMAEGRPVPAFCFGAGTPDVTVDAFNRAQMSPFNTRFQQGARWSTTATNTVTTSQGTPMILTYSFVPDGTIVPTLTTGVTQPSNLFARMNVIYANNTALWQGLYGQVFTQWSQLIRLDYVFEPNDDGVDFGAPGSAGALGVRGDLRMAGTALDGNSGVLAFNYFPGGDIGGDMVVDTNDNFYDNITTNSLRLRNVLAHENGHGIGMAHVCPRNQTKLMEPFISVLFDGPQFDDILNGQRHYGDILEPNDTSGTATVISNLATSSNAVNQISLDNNVEADWFRFSVTGAGTQTLAVTATPIGASYLQGPQTQACDVGTAYEAATANPMTITYFAADGTTVLGTFNAPAAGQPALGQLVVNTAGTYFARVSTTGAANAIQPYNLSYQLSTSPFLSIAVQGTTPSLVSPTTSTSFQTQIVVANQTLSSAQLFYRSGTSGAFTTANLTSLGGSLYQATIPPAACGAPLQFYVRASGSSGSVVTQPATAPAAVFSATVGDEQVIFFDNFSNDLGWSYGVAGDTATTGIWERGDPNGTGAQPEDAFSPGLCAFTGNAAAGAAIGTADVDNGFTTLRSPAINLAGSINPVITYQRWFSNNGGANPNAKVMRVEISNDNGVNWTLAETVGPTTQNAGGWLLGTINVQSFFAAPSSQVRVRFVPDDTGTGSVVEAALDDFRVFTIACNSCIADFDQNTIINTNDIFSFLNAWFAGLPTADVDGTPGLSTNDVFVFLNRWFAGC
ncbi:MAG: matrixin family metalloprotease [Phycisphaerales bacterium]|nr:matrixin family metalloprotease [Phycisphaerales bacterium]